MDVEGKRVTRVQVDLAVGKLADTDFRALQVGQHAHVGTDAHGHLAHQTNRLGVLFGRTMGKVDPDDVDPCLEQPGQHLGRIGCRSKRGNDLGGTGNSDHGAASSLNSDGVSPGVRRPDAL